MSAFIPDGYCGLYCGSCPDYLATRTGNPEEPGESACRGCKTDLTATWCTDCALKACARTKGVEFCSECADFPCPEYEGFIANAKDPYVVEIGGYLATIRDVGRDEWLARMKERWSCPACGTEASWWDLSCRECGAPLEGYPKPAD